MSEVKRKIDRKRLEWVNDAKDTLLMVFGDDIDTNFKTRRTVDPLRFILSINLRYPMPKEARAPIRRFIRMYAEKYDCEVPVIKINKDRFIRAEVLTKHRHRARDAKGKYIKQRFGRGTG